MRSRRFWARAALGAIAIGAIGWGVARLYRPITPDLSLTATGSQLGIVTTVAHNASHTVVTSVPVGTVVHVKATVTGAFGVATGTVQSRVYANGTCSGFIEGESAAVTLSSGVADITAFTYSSKDGGAMSWIVHYSGNATYAARDGACVKVTITKIDPTSTLVIHDPADKVVTQVPLGTNVHPRVALTGTLGVPTGNVETFWWKNGNCFDLAVISQGPFPLVNGVVDAKNFARPSDELGAHSMRSRYLGNSTYNVFWGPCVEYEVVKATPAVYLHIHEPSHQDVQFLPLGASVHTAVSLTGPVGTPSGSVQVWGYDTDNCTGGAVTQTVTAASVIDPATTSATRSTPGYKSWIARYLGDGKYVAKSSACQKVRWMPVPTLTGVVHDAGHHAVTTVAPGSEVHLKVTATGDYGTVTGAVSIYIYTGGTCKSGANHNQGTVTLSSGVADDSSVSYTPSTPGQYYFVPQYVQSQGATYLGATGPCVSFTVASPAVPTPTPAGPPPATPKPTPAPTKEPSPPPTNAPTSAPTGAPTVQPGGTPAASAGGSAASAAPTDGTAATAEPGATAEPAGSAASTGSPGASAAPATAPPGASPGAGPVSSGDGGGVPTILALILVVLVVAGAIVGWRSRRPKPTVPRG
jgi:hypothetical protein